MVPSAQSGSTRFSPVTQAWFEASFAEPTPAQTGAWGAIGRGEHSLVVAPTGSGKTLAAFLWSIDHLVSAPTPPRAERCRVLYISPLKALGVDVERNLRAPLVGLAHTAARLGQPQPELAVGVRSGDTNASERRRLTTSPPDILITTPESLFLMLTSQARESLRYVETVIIDEVHAVAGTKRGAHLALSLERLDALLARPAQRIGLSATVRPVDEVARFLGGAAPVTVVNPPAAKSWDLSVVMPVADMTELATGGGGEGPRRVSIWPQIEERVVDLVAANRATIVFANSRRLAERLTARLNEIWAERLDPQRPGAPDPVEIPAEMMAASGSSDGAPAVLAKAHHGSVSKDQRAIIEDDLKSGRLPCVVATSSLELGIDMGAVDLVIQIESPPSVAGALQRVGRAGHQVGGVSTGVLFPKYRGDLAPTAVTVQRMRAGEIESLRIPANPLDVLAQQIVAMVATETWSVDEVFALVQRAAPFVGLTRSVFEATLDLLAGRYPSEDFAELRPRVVWDRLSGHLSGRPGSQRLAVTSGGTIPDRGLFGVFLAGTGAGRRVGELDEEMVYESRVGDVFTLGATSWRIEDITHDRVLVTPAPGVPGRLPFWKGDTVGRPAELGAALGSFTRSLNALPSAAAISTVTESGLDQWAAENLIEYLTQQRAATGVLPTDRELVFERFRDELGDWRLVVHSPYGTPVHAPWALALSARLRSRYGAEASAMAADDGIVIRVPDTDTDPPTGDFLIFDPDEIEQVVRAEVGGSPLFAARFRECAARALLLPRRDPGRRTPLWQQRQRSAALLEVAARYPSFPIVLETVREVLQDVYDVPSLRALMGQIERREVRIHDVTTTQPSPYAQSLLFSYLAEFVYAGDSPLAERRAAALTLDQSLLDQLLGRAELRDLLDPEVVLGVEHQLQRLAPDRQARNAEGVVDLLRQLGPLTEAEVAARTTSDPGPWLAELAAARRIASVRIAAVECWSTVEDLGRLRDALGVPMPPGIPAAFTEPVADPLSDLVRRYARTHGPFRVADLAQRFGLGAAVVLPVLHRLAAEGRVVEGEFRPAGSGSEWCDTEILRRLRRRSLAVLRSEVEPVEAPVLARFLTEWQHVAGRPLRGVDGVLDVLDQLAGLALPASAWESMILPARVADYAPAMLDELTVAGEVLWAGHGALPGTDGWLSFHLAQSADLSLPEPDLTDLPPLQQHLLDLLGPGGGWFFHSLRQQLPPDLSASEGEVGSALWDLVWRGLVAGDSLAALRSRLATGGAHRAPARPPRSGRVRPGRRLPRPGAPAGSHLAGSHLAGSDLAGRWSRLPAIDPDHTRRTHALAEQLLERYGVVTRAAVTAEQPAGGFGPIYRVLSAFEESGHCRRGYFVEGLGAAQFGASGTIDRLRAHPEPDDPQVLTLAATDPANPYGAALPWPRIEQGHRPGRKAGAFVVLSGGALTLYVERGGRSILSFTADPDVLRDAAAALADVVRRGALGRLGKLTIEKADGDALLGSVGPLREALEEAGFVATPRGLRIRG